MSTSKYQVRLFGGFDSTPWLRLTRKESIFLAYLLTHHGRASIVSIASALWPEHSYTNRDQLSAAQSRIKTIINQIRKKIGDKGTGIFIQGDDQVTVKNVSCDLLDFEYLVSSAEDCDDIEERRRLYHEAYKITQRGDILSGNDMWAFRESDTPLTWISKVRQRVEVMTAKYIEGGALPKPVLKVEVRNSFPDRLSLEGSEEIRHDTTQQALREQPRDTGETLQNWLNAVARRVGGHPFAKSGALEEWLRKLFETHFHGQYSTIAYPLPGTPKLPLNERWVELRLTPSAERRDREQRFSYEGSLILETLKNEPQSAVRLVETHQDLVILGEPGSGKSTLLRWLCCHLIRETRSTSLIPLYFPLRAFVQWRVENSKGTLYRFIWEHYGGRPEGFADFHRFISDVEDGDEGLRNLVMIFLDGWDEVPVDIQQDLASQITRFEHLMPVWVASRPSGRPTILSSSPRYRITRLSLESMRLLIRQLFREQGYPEQEEHLCHHLDKHIDLRSLAGNPFVLTLLCVIAANRVSSPLPRTREETYSAFIQLVGEYYATTHPAIEKKIWKSIEDVAKKLLLRQAASPYEFTRNDLSIFGSGFPLASILEDARLISATDTSGIDFSFLHATIHEYLASRAIASDIIGGDMGYFDHLLEPERQEVLRFLFGNRNLIMLPAVSTAVRGLAAHPDRFGVVYLTLAKWLHEAQVDDFGLQLLGFDIRERLWFGFVHSPIWNPYAEVLVQLDPIYTINCAYRLPQATGNYLPRLMDLMSLIPPSEPRRMELAMLATQRMPQTVATQIYETSSPLFGLFGTEFERAHNLTQAEQARSAADIRKDIEMTEDPRRKKAYLAHLALVGGMEAESYFQENIDSVAPDDVPDVIECLSRLGTLHAGDLLMRLIARFAADHAIVESCLRKLAEFPTDSHAERIEAYLQNEGMPVGIRAAAARALSFTHRFEIRDLLTRYASLQEPDPRVRIAALDALRKRSDARPIYTLYQEKFHERTKEEHGTLWSYYLASIPLLESEEDGKALYNELEDSYLGELVMPSDYRALIASQGKVFRRSGKVRAALAGLACDASATQKERIAAADAIGAIGTKIIDVMALRTAYLRIYESAETELVATALARAIGTIDIDSLAALKGGPAHQALWEIAIHQSKYIFD